MGFVFTSVEGDASFGLQDSGVAILLDVFQNQQLLDLEARPPEPPPEVRAVTEGSRIEAALDGWPFSADLSEEERAFFGFESGDPDRIPIAKLQDHALWLITERECALIIQVVAELHDRTRPMLMSDTTLNILERDGVPDSKWTETVDYLLYNFAELCKASASLGGFWAR